MQHDNQVACLNAVTQRYRSTVALDDVSLEFPAQSMVGLIGPDGVGKSTLLSILAGARQIQFGTVLVLDGDMADPAHRAAVCPRIAYMPQGLGKNLYPDLSVRENIEFFGRLFGQARQERAWRIAELLASTGLAPFADRPAKKRQKLGLCCSLIHDPDLLILDEPTTGVDPLSRRQFWELIDRMRARRSGMSVIVATAYMEEAERFDWLVAMDAAKVLITGAPATLKRELGVQTVEAAFIAALPEERRAGHKSLHIPPRPILDAEPVIVARDLTCRFGDFTAVDRVSFSIERGEIFGFLGSNGCGKTTTMKMLTGLLPPTEGEALLFGQPSDARDLEARKRVGYMSQSFSLYTELTVRQNLDLHARLFHLPLAKGKARIDDLVARFGLAGYLDQPTLDLPLGIRQRLSLAVAVVHEPEMLILDEPTSGVDPLARDAFWELLIDLARNQGVTIFISTHFMNEAERCDRIALMDGGRVLATDTPTGLVKARGAGDLEDTFISYLEEATKTHSPSGEGPSTIIELERSDRSPAAVARPELSTSAWLSLRRLSATAIREALELIRGPIRLGFALFGTTLLMLVFGFGISTDVNNLAFAVLDRDQSHESRAYLEELRGSTYFTERPPLKDYADLDKRMQSGDIRSAIEIPPDFGRNIKAGRPVVTMLAIILAGAAIVREREHGTMDHLLVMPLTPFEIALSKVWANGLVIIIAVGLSLYLVVRAILGVPITGSIPLFMVGTAIYLFFATSIGIFLGTVARSMPQLGLLFMLVFLPMNMLSGSNTPLENIPPWLATIMRASPSTHFVSFAQSILYRGAWIDVVWTEFFATALIGSLFFALALWRFRSVTAQAT